MTFNGRWQADMRVSRYLSIRCLFSALMYSVKTCLNEISKAYI